MGKLISLSKQKHLSEFTIEELITDFSLYQTAIIDLKDIRIIGGRKLK